MISILAFRVETETVTEEIRSEVPFMRVHVVPLIDGIPYIREYKNYPFEALSVYAMGLKDGEVWSFNCECGTPSCARINEPMKLLVEGACVHWKLPDEPFTDLAVNDDGTSKPRDIFFDRSQYKSAFHALISELKILEKIHGTLKIHPISNRSTNLDDEIEIERNWAEYRRIRRVALGDLDDENVEFVVSTKDGLELASGLPEIVYELTRDCLSAGKYDLGKARQVLGNLGSYLRNDPGKLLQQLDVHRLSAQLRATNVVVSDDDEELELWPAPYWTGPESPQEKIDFWIEVQRVIPPKNHWGEK